MNPGLLTQPIYYSLRKRTPIDYELVQPLVHLALHHRHL